MSESSDVDQSDESDIESVTTALFISICKKINRQLVLQNETKEMKKKKKKRTYLDRGGGG
jgi:hypothetical protein